VSCQQPLKSLRDHAAGAEPDPAPALDEAEPVAATSADSSRADGSDQRPD